MQDLDNDGFATSDAEHSTLAIRQITDSLMKSRRSISKVHSNLRRQKERGPQGIVEQQCTTVLKTRQEDIWL